MTDPAWIHAGIEAAKLAMADRDAFLTDPGFRDVPVARLTEPGYAASLAARIDPGRAARPVPATNPAGGGTIYLSASVGVNNAGDKTHIGSAWLNPDHTAAGEPIYIEPGLPRNFIGSLTIGSTF